MTSKREHASIAAVVVLYRPGQSALDNIESYRDQVAAVFAVDNTEQSDDEFVAALEALPGLHYLANGANLGIATALNIGSRAARDAGFAWVLTMDQDSTGTPGMVATLLHCAMADPTIALVSPVHQQVGGNPREAEPGCRDVLTAMTSGNAVSLAALERVGWFMDELFIDEVDSELCLRLLRNGLRVVQAGAAELIHRVGSVKRHRFPLPSYTSNHSASRRYYIARNRAFVSRMYAHDYPQYRRAVVSATIKDVIKIVLYEHGKAQKLHMMWHGWRDCRAGRLGAFRG
jgi:rhamnosyltransferase